MSKLAALAARRRQKENEKSPSQNIRVPTVSELASPAADTENPKETSSNETDEKPGASNKFSRSAKFSGPKSSPKNHSTIIGVTRPGFREHFNSTQTIFAQASPADPSPFAATLLGLNEHVVDVLQSLADFTATGTRTEIFNFVDPSPDDIVGQAQTSKGSN